MKSTRRKTHAFTLVELLVVVAIIALLISILFPSLRGAREQTKRVMCRNNLRSIWTGVLMYSYEYNDRVPYMESVNQQNPDADPFDPQYPLSEGQVLLRYVNPESWRCPAAVNGFPQNAGKGQWKITYDFSTANRSGFIPVAYDKHPSAYTLSATDPASQNYIHFDGRPIRLLDGRRYVSRLPAHGNQNAKGYWKVRFPIISDMLAGEVAGGRAEYPHRAPLDVRTDLANAREDFEKSTGGGPGVRPAYHELHADGDKIEFYLTRFWLASLGG